MPASAKPPVVLLFAGSDPTGGAGITADIETVGALGCHPAPVITAVTAQDTRGLRQFSVVETELVVAQARAVLEDMPVAAIKTGMLGSEANLAAIATIAADYAHIPLVVDPVSHTGAGDDLSEESLDAAYRSLLLPRATLTTPNSLEAARLAPEGDTIDAQAQELLALGCAYVLISGGHEDGREIESRLFGNRRLLESFRQPRLPHQYHGSGCTLAAACAAGLAQGLEPVAAVGPALQFVWNSLQEGVPLGMGQWLPNRRTLPPNGKA
jgi:hydroxymethylpyrimidine/phosphomethylpyrimidine kinase